LSSCCGGGSTGVGGRLFFGSATWMSSSNQLPPIVTGVGRSAWRGGSEDGIPRRCAFLWSRRQVLLLRGFDVRRGRSWLVVRRIVAKPGVAFFIVPGRGRRMLREESCWCRHVGLQRVSTGKFSRSSLRSRIDDPQKLISTAAPNT